MTQDAAHALGVMDKSHYGNVEEEYRLLIQAAGLIHFGRVSWVSLEGPDAASFLQGLTTQHGPGIPVGEAREGWLLNAAGKILYSITIYRPQPQTLLLQCGPGLSHQLVTHLDRYLIMEDATLKAVEDWDCYSLQGPSAQDHKDVLSPNRHFAVHRCEAGGFDFFGPRSEVQPVLEALLEKGVGHVGLDAWNRARLEAFIPWFGVDMTADNNPMIYGHQNRLSATKGCYLGQETVAMTRDRGRPPMRLCQLRAQSGDPPTSPTPLLNKQHGVGTITSAAQGKDHILALATLKHAVAEKGEPVEDTSGRRWHIEAVAPYKD